MASDHQVAGSTPAGRAEILSKIKDLKSVQRACSSTGRAPPS